MSKGQLIMTKKLLKSENMGKKKSDDITKQQK